MKAMIQIQTKLSHNKEFELLSKNLLELKICGKELFSYYFDLLNELNVQEIYIVDSQLKTYINEYYFSDVFAPKIKFINEENINSIENSDMIFIKNIGFLLDSFSDIKNILIDEKENFKIKDRTFELIYTNKESKESTIVEKNLLKIKSLQSLKDYIFISNSILSSVEEIDYTLGYSSNDGIIIGKNVQIDRSCILKKPIIILDNVKISKNCVLGPNLIIQNDVYIDENTQILDSIIYNNRFVSCNLNIKDKITSVNNLIDTKSFQNHSIDKIFIN